MRTLALLILAAAASDSLVAQEAPLRATATFSTGYYSTYTRNELNQSVTFVPAYAQFNVSGFVFSPDLIDFTAQPELALGPQASEAGFQGGNGLQLRLSFLRKRMFPFTFRYSNLHREDVYFGSLSQISAYSLQNHVRDLGLTLEIKPSRLPVTTIDASTGSVDSRSDVAFIPDYKSHMNHLNADTSYERWGWNIGGFAHHQHQASNLFAPVNGGLVESSLTQTVTEFQGAGQHPLFSDSEISLAGGAQATDSRLFDLPVNLQTRFANANLRLFQRRRWKASIRASYSSNAATQLLTQLLGGATAGLGVIAPDQTVLLALRQDIANLNLNALTSIDVGHGFGIFGSADETQVVASSQQTALDSSYFTTSAGLTYTTGFRGGRFSGQYARDFGEGSITGQSGTIRGQNYMVSVQHGDPSRIRFDISIRGLYQNVDNAQPVNNDSFSAEATASRAVAGSFTVRAGGGWQQGTFRNAANEFRSEGYTARADLEHPRVQIGAAISNALGNSLPVYAALLTGLPSSGILLAPIHVVPSDYRSITFTIHSNPFRKLEFSGMYTRSNQHLDGLLSNDFELINFHALYHYRRVQIEAGYIRSNQIFAAYPETRRGRLYVRVSRNVRLL